MGAGLSVSKTFVCCVTAGKKAAVLEVTQHYALQSVQEGGSRGGSDH